MKKDNSQTTRYFISSDNSGHEYFVEWDKRNDWIDWCNLSEDDERGWDVPPYAERIDGENLTFEKPEITSW